MYMYIYTYICIYKYRYTHIDRSTKACTFCSARKTAVTWRPWQRFQHHKLMPMAVEQDHLLSAQLLVISHLNTYQWVVAHMCMRHVTHIPMYVIRMNQSCHTNEYYFNDVFIIMECPLLLRHPMALQKEPRLPCPLLYLWLLFYPLLL